MVEQILQLVLYIFTSIYIYNYFEKKNIFLSPMVEVLARGRLFSMPGGHKDFLDRSRSRDVIIGRGEEYGRRVDRDLRRGDRSPQDKDVKIRGKDDSTATNAGPEKEGMHRGGGGY